MRKLGPILTILLSAGSPAAAAERPLFTAYSEHPERPRQRQVRPAPALVRLVLRAVDSNDVRLLDTCIAEQRLRPGDYGSLLRAVRIRAGPDRLLWFVRPVLRPPYCPALYGAHLFRYFLFEERTAGARPRYRLVFQNGGDYFAVYRRLHRGLNDIEATSCTVGDCWTVRMAYDGMRYRPSRCSHTAVNRGQEVTRPRRCEPDGERAR